MSRKHPLRLAGANLALLRPDPTLLRIVVFKGVPMGLQMIVISAAALTVMGIVNSYGSQVAAAYGIAAQLWTYIQMPALAIGAAVSSMAAQNVGAGRWDRIGRIAASGVGFNLVLTGALVALLFVLRPPGAQPVPQQRQRRDRHRRPHQQCRVVVVHPVRRHHRAVRHRARHRCGDAAADHPGDLGARRAHRLCLFLPRA